jgi:ADP-heptose:LPS heptosyltransferase
MSFKNKKKEVLVIVHDAGGAEVIGAYIRKNSKRQHFVCYGAGPAKKIFARLGVRLHHVPPSAQELSKVMRQHRGVHHALIAAPGWMSTTEINALKAAKKAGIKTVCYMDSWEDERKRFGYPHKGWKSALPDEFWAGDRYAYANIQKQYPHMPLRLVPNQYFAEEMKRYRALKRAVSAPGEILFVSQDRPGSHELLKELLRVLGRREKRVRLRIRYHPVDNRTRYDALIQHVRGRVEVLKSKEKDLVKDLVHAHAVVGTETGAMAVAVLLRIPTISYLPRHRRPMLPFPQIKRVRSIKNIERYI